MSWMLDVGCWMLDVGRTSSTQYYKNDRNLIIAVVFAALDFSPFYEKKQRMKIILAYRVQCLSNSLYVNANFEI